MTYCLIPASICYVVEFIAIAVLYKLLQKHSEEHKKIMQELSMKYQSRVSNHPLFFARRALDRCAPFLCKVPHFTPFLPKGLCKLAKRKFPFSLDIHRPLWYNINVVKGVKSTVVSTTDLNEKIFQKLLKKPLTNHLKCGII